MPGGRAEVEGTGVQQRHAIDTRAAANISSRARRGRIRTLPLAKKIL